MYKFREGLMFENIYSEQLDAVLKPLSKEVHIPAGTLFLPAGDSVDCIYYIKSGTTRHCMTSPEGSEKLLYCLSAGWLFGETALFFTTHTSLSSYAETDLHIYKIPEETCNKLLATNEMFREVLLKSYSSKILALRYEIENLTFNSTKDRIKRLYCSTVDTETVTDPGWYNLKKKYKQQEICVIVGGARITITKLINELCNEGFIRIINRVVQVNAEKYNDFITEYEHLL